MTIMTNQTILEYDFYNMSFVDILFANLAIFLSVSNWLFWSSFFDYTGCPKKKETGQTCPFLLNLTSIWIHLCIICLEGYLLFPMVPRYVGSVMSVNKNKLFKNRLTIWLCTKMLKLRVVPSLLYLQTFFQIADFTGIGTTRKSCFQPPASYRDLFDTIQLQENLCSFVSYIIKCFWQYKSAIAHW